MDRFHDFKEMCEKANTTVQQFFNGRDNIMDLTKLIKIKQEVSDETVYHDAVHYPVDEKEDEINDDCDDGSDGEDEEYDADNDQGSPPGHDSRDCDNDAAVEVKDQFPVVENSCNNADGVPSVKGWRHEKYSCNINPSCNKNKVNIELGTTSKKGETDLYTCHYCSKSFIHRGSWWRHEKSRSAAKTICLQILS